MTAGKKELCKKRIISSRSFSEDEENLPKKFANNNSESPDEEQDLVSKNNKNLMKAGEYALIKFVTNKGILKYYVGKILSELEELQITFMKKLKGSTASFAFPKKGNVSVANKCDIILLLRQAITVVSTKRVISKEFFRVDFAGF